LSRDRNKTCANHSIDAIQAGQRSAAAAPKNNSIRREA
jgi:hypothetical protein